MTQKVKIPENHPYKDGRVCTKCNTMKPASEYTLSRDKRSFGGVAMRSDCKICMEKRKYKAFIKKTYNFTYEQYEEMFDAQDGKCAICESRMGNGRTNRLFVDHCHDTLKIRGLLCGNCNSGLGHFRDSPKLLQRAIKYLSDEN